MPRIRPARGSGVKNLPFPAAVAEGCFWGGGRTGGVFSGFCLQLPRGLQWDVSSYWGEVSNILPAASFGVPLRAASGALCLLLQSILDFISGGVLDLWLEDVQGTLGPAQKSTLHKTQLSHRNFALLPFSGGSVHVDVCAHICQA